MFIIAHPLSSTDKLENNCHIKKAENMLSFKHLHRVRNKPSQKCRYSPILESQRISSTYLDRSMLGFVSKTEFPEAGLGWASTKPRWEF